MSRFDILEVLSKVRDLKSRLSFPVVDVHFHPLDVMGLVPPNGGHDNRSDKASDPLTAGPLELFRYDRIAKIGTAAAFAVLPAFIDSTVRNTFSDYGLRKIISEADVSAIDQICLLPIAPWVTTDDIGRLYSGNKRFHILGSIDIHRTDPAAVPALLEHWVQTYRIVGLKLHPNLQSFSPQPSQNSPRVRETLKRLYDEAERQRLYLHFHAGRSFYTKAVHESYISSPRSRAHGTFDQFFSGENSEVFGQYDIPIIVAHLASYGVANPDALLMRRAVHLHKRLYFDTSGVSPRIIEHGLSTVGPDHIVFGSDGAYNKMAFNITFLWQALQNSAISNIEEAAADVLGRTYVNAILNADRI